MFPLTTAGSQKEGQTPGDTATPAPERPPDQQGPSPLDRLLRLLVEGIKFGAIIAITAVGLSLIFGTTHIINFAHGELVTIGATVAFFLNAATVGPGWQLVPAAALAVVVGGGTGAGLHAGLWRPLERRGTGRIQLLIISIGLSLLLRHAI
ncbi:MAG: hypothetical protein GEV09_28515, partial [Pseudonocardiaceae bacterium]|nr:hypothetical protein [Pseudonocardiaceae bacterium]